MPETVVTSKLFQAAVGFGKDIARKKESSTLTISYVVAGFAVLVTQHPAEPLEWLQLNEDRFTEHLRSLEIEPNSLITLPEGEKMPVAEDLRELISKRGGSLEEFGKALVDWLGHADLFGGDEFLRIIRRASAVAERAGASSVDGEAFCVGAFALFVHGEAKQWPLLSVLMSASAECVHAILADRGWSVPDADAKKTLPVSDEFRAAVAKGEERQEPLLRLLNVGLSSGAERLAAERTAYHEAGHAVASYILRPGLTVTNITNVKEGDALGCTYYDKDSPFWKRITAESVPIALCVALAGRVAEQIRYGRNEADDGAVSDIEQATRIAWRAITELGLDEEFGCLNLSLLTQKLGQPTGFLFDEAQRTLQRMLKQAAVHARTLLEENWPLVEGAAQALIAERTLNGGALLQRLIVTGLEGAPGAVRAVSLPVERWVTFADAAGVIITAEGPVRHLAGDAIVQDDRGESWPVGRAIFEKTYEPVGDIRLGTDGLYQKLSRSVWAQKMSHARRIDMSEGRGVLRGSKGDWIVDYGDGDLAIVNADVFSRTYKIEK